MVIAADTFAPKKNKGAENGQREFRDRKRRIMTLLQRSEESQLTNDVWVYAEHTPEKAS